MNKHLKKLLSVKETTVVIVPINDNANNHQNYNFLNCDWFKKLLFPTNSPANWTVCYQAVQQTNHIQSCSLNQPITFKVVVSINRSQPWFQLL